MKTRKIKKSVLIILLLLFTAVVFAHPTGNLITVGENVLWSYINPVNDPNHYACVMIWKKGAEPKVLIQSEYAASDYMLYNDQNEIYVLERKYSQTADVFEIRILKTTVDDEPTIIWDWFKDDYRIGEGGFFMISDTKMVFGRYPDVYTLKRGGTPEKYFEFNQPIKRIRALERDQILLLGDSSCYLVQYDGTILKQWGELIDGTIKDAPLNRNQIFDVDYFRGELLLSYWGKRSFDIINNSGRRETILRQTEPLTPHWVAFWNDEKLLFSSGLVFDGSTPKPYLILLNEHNNQELLWSKQ